MKRLIAFLLASSLLMSLGFSPVAEAASRRPSKPKKLIVKATGFTQDPESGQVSVGSIIQNPNKDKMATGVTVSVTAFDLNDRIVGTASEDIDVILRNSEGVSGLSFSVTPENATVARIEVKAKESRFETQRRDVPFFSPENIAVSQDEFGNTHVTGQIRNPFDSDFESLTVEAIFFDASGNIVGGDHSIVDKLEANDTATFEVESMIKGINATSARAYVSSFSEASALLKRLR